MVINYITLGMQLVGVVSVLILVFYASKLLRTFRHGILEKGWRLLTFGTIALALAQVPLLLSGIVPGSIGALLNYGAFAIRFLGVALLIFGLRAQHDVWRCDNKDLSPVINPAQAS
jgi:hypothetical protein